MSDPFGPGGKWGGKPAPSAEFPGIGYDPAPGKPASCEPLEANLTKAASEMVTAQEILKGITLGGASWEGEAAQKFIDSEVMEKLPGRLRDAEKAMRTAATQLEQWRGQLTGYQAKRGTLESGAVEARRKRDAAQGDVDRAKDDPAFDLAGRWFGTDKELADAERRMRTAQVELDAAGGRLTVADADLERILIDAENLLGQHATEAAEHARRIEEAGDKAPNKPFDLAGFLGGVGDFLSVAGALLGVVALFCPVLAPFAIVMSLAALGLRATSYGMQGKLDEPGAWLNLGGDALGALPGVGALAKGVTAGVRAGRAVNGAKGVVSGVGTGMKTFQGQAGRISGLMANPAIIKPTAWVAGKAGAGANAAQNIGKGVQGALTAGFNYPTIASLPNNDWPGTTSSSTPGGLNNVLGGVGFAGTKGAPGGVRGAGGAAALLSGWAAFL
ncbi:hypothetical protein [Embleya sp. NBC_00896]|uniref:hypothetical protein n=1 Tax=Embleya sp. NBC_00896 TaxID=2975961 RepID=UPI0038673BC2|nr:hypothetical protein OG928_12700 [Embleya sp. NBC_00896]